MGIEIDVRYHENDLILHHDPFGHNTHQPLKLEKLLSVWDSEAPIILNIKTEGVEDRCIEYMNKHGVESWFFLDLSMPYFVRYSNLAFQKEIEGFSIENLAVRYSEREPIEYAASFRNKASWMWVDCFEILPINDSIHKNIKELGFKICLVSPELQGHSLERIDEFRKQLGDLFIDAVCTKRPDLWQ